MNLSDSYFLPVGTTPETRAMVFVDGENLSIRYQEILGSNSPADHVRFERDVYVWSRYANLTQGRPRCQVIRRHFYTSVQGDTSKIEAVEDELKELGIEAPRVFQKPKGRRAKRVDIQLTAEMLSHAHRGNFDLAILVAGDQDYVPLVEAVKYEGKRVVVWFFRDGLSRDLVLAADHAFNIAKILLEPTGQVQYLFM